MARRLPLTEEFRSPSPVAGVLWYYRYAVVFLMITALLIIVRGSGS